MKLSAIFDVKRFVGAGMLFIISALVLQGVIDRFWPTSYWLEMIEVHVDDAPVGTAPRMTERRIIHRKFAGSYRAEVEVQRQDRPNKYTLVCRATGGDFDYAPDNEPPEDLDLFWWVGDACKKGESGFTIIDVRNLPVGVYRVETCRTIMPLKFFSPRVVCLTSNHYRVYDPKAQS